jgi:hypothetical protein
VSPDASAQRVLLLHDGELADVAGLLHELGIACAERLAGIAPGDVESHWRLVIASARRALELPWPLVRSSAFRIAIIDGPSRTVRALLQRASFELVVTRPVHPVALRLLLLHTLYRGPEKRRTPRVSVGAPVRFRAGLRRHRAILAEISERGCRLLSSQRVSLGQSLMLQIPASLAGGRAFAVKGLVVRATPAQVGVPGILTLAFDGAPAAVRVQLRALVAAHAVGPSALPGSAAPAMRPVARPLTAKDAAAATAPRAEPAPAPPPVAPEPAAQAAPVPNPDPDPDLDFALGPPLEHDDDLDLDLDLDLDTELEPDPQRLADGESALSAQAKRHALIPLCDEASRVVLARGLSREGMRADPSPRLARSSEVSLALHLASDAPPLRVNARVEPGEAGEGPWLRFKDLSPAEAERLDALLAGLSVFSAGDGPEHALVVCEIVGPDRG